MNLKVGDVVCFKDGGLKMTITAMIGLHHCEATWFNGALVESCITRRDRFDKADGDNSSNEEILRSAAANLE